MFDLASQPIQGEFKIDKVSHKSTGIILYSCTNLWLAANRQRRSTDHGLVLVPIMPNCQIKLFVCVCALYWLNIRLWFWRTMFMLNGIHKINDNYFIFECKSFFWEKIRVNRLKSLKGKYRKVTVQIWHIG